MKTNSRWRLVLVTFKVLMTAIALAQTVQHAEKFPGPDAGEKIRNCMAALPPQGGICDARELSGQQSPSAGFNVGMPGRPVELMMGPVTLNTRGTIHVFGNTSVLGKAVGVCH